MIASITRSVRHLAWSFTTSAVLIAGLTRCVGGDVVAPTDVGANTPAVGMSAGEFGFAVMARDWTYDQSYAPDLQNGTLQVGLVVAGYSHGTGELAVVDGTGTSVYSQNLASNIAAGNNAVVRGSPPYRIRLTTSHFTGTISLGISAGEAAGH